MRYNNLDAHDHVFAVPEMTLGDGPLYIGLTPQPWRRWAYTVATGPYDAAMQWEGVDLRDAPARESTAVETASALMSFISAYGEGHLEYTADPPEHDSAELYAGGELVAVGETAEFLYAVAERMGSAHAGLAEGYTAYTDTYWDDNIGRYAMRAVPTGKETE